MASKLVIIKQTRPSADVAFFAMSAEQKASVKTDSAVVAVAGERNVGRSLIKVRTLFFPYLAAYEEWQTSSVVAEVASARSAYNAANGITERVIEIDLPNLNLLGQVANS